MLRSPFWKGIFSFHLSERRAIFLLVLLLLFLKSIPVLRKQHTEEPFTSEDWIALIQEQDSIQQDDQTPPEPAERNTKRKSVAISYDFFDPNTISRQQLQSWQIPDRVISTWFNFRNAGGRFRKPEDIHRIYGLADHIAEELFNYVQIQPAPVPADTLISIDTSEQIQMEVVETNIQEEPLVLDINQSTESDWIRLPGIGPYYAGRILRFREALGGFTSIDQIGETWNLPDTVFQKIRSQLEYSPPYRKLAINDAQDPDELAKHPYLSKKQAGVIIRFRNNYGPIQDGEMLLRTGVLEEEDIDRLIPYIQF